MGLIIGFIELVTTNNYDTLSNLHSLQTNTPHARPSQFIAVNNGDFSQPTMNCTADRRL